ncbi:MAG TPA: beta-galactosidase, partial [Isosphaeraceae bacterium]|nr:beta-galactosidase [Isosphaeraceae bacterium]
KVETTGAPTHIRLLPDRRTLLADSEDTVPVAVEILDSKGRVVPYAANRVRFSVAGPGSVAGVGNGDPSDHDPDQASSRKAFHGLCMVLVRSNDHAGPLTLTASAPGLSPASVKFTSSK